VRSSRSRGGIKWNRLHDVVSSSSAYKTLTYYKRRTYTPASVLSAAVAGCRSVASCRRIGPGRVSRMQGPLIDGPARVVRTRPTDRPTGRLYRTARSVAARPLLAMHTRFRRQ